MSELLAMGKAARAASVTLGLLPTETKNKALHTLATSLEEQADFLLQQNALDLEAGRAKGLSESLLDRLLLNKERLANLAHDTRHIAALPDPVGEEFDGRLLPNGLSLRRRRIPLGVLGVIYEARPNVTIDVTALCLKTGNAVILRGGSETLQSNLALVQVIHDSLKQAGLPPEAVQYIANPDRTLVAELLRLDDYVDMIIPRGGAALHKRCRQESSIPVITGGIGICHIFVDESAQLERAVEIVENAKVQRPSVCNALDTLLVHQAVAGTFLPAVAARLAPQKVILHATPEAQKILQPSSSSAQVVDAGPDDFDQEWLSLHLGVKVVADLDEAIEHIRQHSSQHSDSILTQTWDHAQRFVTEVDSSAVYVNASTRFTDGGQFGLGAEVAISTQKLHARGPMGLQELTTYKWILFGDQHIRP